MNLKSLIYPIIGFCLIFGVSTILLKIFKQSVKKSLCYSLLLGFIYLLLMIPNIRLMVNDKNVIVDKSGMKCGVKLNHFYDEYNSLNRYNPFFTVDEEISKPKNCSDLEGCYWATATYDQFESCVLEKNKKEK